MPELSKEDEAKVRALMPILNEAIDSSESIKEAYGIIRYCGFEVRISSFNLEIVGKYVIDNDNEERTEPREITWTSQDLKFLGALKIDTNDIPKR